jgi:phosphoglycolate phosphatase-like HAD superfamily hydrolase
MQVARDAGMTAVGRVTNGNQAALRAAGAHFLVPDLTQLPPLLANL